LKGIIRQYGQIILFYAEIILLSKKNPLQTGKEEVGGLSRLSFAKNVE